MEEVVQIKESHYQDSPDYQADLESSLDILTPERYADLRRTLNHDIARAARRGIIFPREGDTRDRYRHDGDTSNEWDLVASERLRMARSRARDAEIQQELGDRPGSTHIRSRMAGHTAHMLLWQSGAALLSILGVLYPMRSTVEMARLLREHDPGWSHEFQSDLERLEQYAECGCELVVTEPVTDFAELWRNLAADREALWGRIRELSGYDLASAQTSY